MKKLMSVFVMGAALAAFSAAFAGPDKTVTWEKCANHGATCGLNGPNTVRYGFTDNWSTKEFKGNVDCHPAAFGDGEMTGEPFGDGEVELHKWCEVSS